MIHEKTSEASKVPHSKGPKAASQDKSTAENSDKITAVEQLQHLVSDDLLMVNATIMEKMHSNVPMIPELAGHLIASGGKRLRPMLTLASAQMLGVPADRPIRLAACVEFIHTATLLHDDVVDESALRRGKETANNIWGNQASVLVGDFLFSRSFELMVEDGSLEVLRILSNASSIIAEGEVLQLSIAGDLKTNHKTYLEVIGAKTAALFAAACEIAAVAGDREQEAAEALRTYGHALGIAFQIIDDVLDYSAKEATLGKTIGDDFREGKVTLPVLLAYRESTPEEAEFWHRTIETHKQQADDLQTALKLFEKYDTLEKSIIEAREYGDAAKRALSIFDDNPAKSALVSIIDFCIERAY